MDFNISKFYFHTSALFEGISKEHLQALKSAMKNLEKKKGELIFKKGSYSKGIYILRKGKVKVYHEDGKVQILYIFKKGEFFGYKPLLCNEPNPVTAEVLEDAVISFIPKAAFLEVLQRSPQLSNTILFNLSHEFTVWVNTAAAFAQQSVKERFALILLILNEKYKKNGDKKPVELNLSREDLASYVGTAIETLVRILREFKEKGMLEVKGRKIKIINPAALIELTNWY